MINLDKFVPLDVADKKKKRGGRKGALTMICSEKNGKRLMLSAELVETLDLGEEQSVQMGFIGKKLVLAKTLPGEANRFELKKAGKKYAIYSSDLVHEISIVQEISFERTVSYTWYKPVIDETFKFEMFFTESGYFASELWRNECERMISAALKYKTE